MSERMHETESEPSRSPGDLVSWSPVRRFSGAALTDPTNDQQSATATHEDEAFEESLFGESGGIASQAEQLSADEETTETSTEDEAVSSAVDAVVETTDAEEFPTVETSPQSSSDFVPQQVDIARLGNTPTEQLEGLQFDFVTKIGPISGSDTATAMGPLGNAAQSILDSLAGDAARALGTIDVEAAQAHGEITSAYATQEAAMAAARDAAVASISDEFARQQGILNTITANELEHLHGAADQKREDAVSFFDGLKTETISAGETEGVRAITASEERAVGIEAEAADFEGGADPTLGRAQREGARQIGERAALRCRETGAEVAQRVRDEAVHHATTGYEPLAQTCLDQLNEIVTAAETDIVASAAHAAVHLEGMAQRAIAAAETLCNAAMTALDGEKATVEATIDSWATSASAALQEAVTVLAERVRAEISSLESAIEQPLDDDTQLAYDAALTALTAWGTDVPVQLAETLAGLSEGLGSLVNDAVSGAAESAASLLQKLDSLASAAVDGMAAFADSFGQSTRTAVDTVIDGMADIVRSTETDAQPAHESALAAFAQLVDDALSAEDALIDDARAEMTGASGKIADEYATLRSEAEDRNEAEGGIWDSITGFFTDLVNSVRTWFIDTFGEFWGGLIFGILSGIVIVAVGFLAVVGLGALLFAVGIEAAVAAVVAVVVAVAAAVALAIYNRFQEFYADNENEDAGFWRGLGLVGLGIADLTGIPYIVEAAVGQRAFGRELTASERGERLGLGLVFLVANIVSARNFFRSRPKAPLEPKPDATTGKIEKGMPPSPPRDMADVMKWGTGEKGVSVTEARIETLTREELIEGGVTRELAEQWRDFYLNEAQRNPYSPSTGRGNQQAAPRARLMQRAVDLLTDPTRLTVPLNPSGLKRRKP
jgi:hypothetical protein